MEPTVFLLSAARRPRRAAAAALSSTHAVEHYGAVAELLAAADPDRPGCVLLEIGTGDAAGHLAELNQAGAPWPVVVLASAAADTGAVVAAMRAGAVNFLLESCAPETCAQAVDEALACDAAQRKRRAHRAKVLRRLARLSSGERAVFDLIVQGYSNDSAARELQLAVRTVEVRRAKLMQVLEAGSLAELVRMAVAAETP